MRSEPMIIVSGSIYVAPTRRDPFVAASLEAVVTARNAPGCLDFVVSADPLELDRVNVYERWETDAAVEAFRGEGPGPDLTADIVRAEVSRYDISSTGPA
jgi:quinol monooxygenase YgiN